MPVDIKSDRKGEREQERRNQIESKAKGEWKGASARRAFPCSHATAASVIGPCRTHTKKVAAITVSADYRHCISTVVILKVKPVRADEEWESKKERKTTAKRKPIC